MTTENRCQPPGKTYQDIGVAFGGIVTLHEQQEHDGARCEAVRLELAAFVFHCLELGPSQIDDMRKRLVDHLNNCHCGSGRELRR